MDTISRENNPSILPVVGAILGGLGLVLSIVALVKLGTVKKLSTEVGSVKAQVESVAGDISAANSKAADARQRVDSLASQTQAGFNQVSSVMETMRADINKLATLKTPAPKAAKDGAAPKDGAPAAAGPGGDYTIKAGDTPAKVARAHGVSLDALMAANPGLEPTKLKVGQKINLPK
jgi:LysM repeat protein